MYTIRDLSEKLKELESSWRIYDIPVSTRIHFKYETQYFILQWYNGGIFLLDDLGAYLIRKGGQIVDNSPHLTPQMFRKLAENLQFLKEMLFNEVPKELIDTIDRLK